jgi:hypothetical protein
LWFHSLTLFLVTCITYSRIRRIKTKTWKKSWTKRFRYKKDIIQEVIKSARIQDFESLKVINFKRSRRHPDHSLKFFRLTLLSETVVSYSYLRCLLLLKLLKALRVKICNWWFSTTPMIKLKNSIIINNNVLLI